MFFGLGPFNLGFNFGNQQPNLAQMPAQQQQPNIFGGQQQNNVGGIFNQFMNFMNPQFETNQNRRNQPPQEQAPRPAFFRRGKGEKDRMASVPKQEPVNPNTGLFWKNKGNQAYKNKRYEEAIELYSKAIQLNNTQSVFFSNRAKAFKMLNKIEDALKDAQQAIQLDSSNPRGHIIVGQCLAQLGKREGNVRRMQNAITRLTKALTLSGNKKIEIQKQASRSIYLAKKVLFYIQFNQLRNARLQKLQEYRNYLEKDETLDNEAKQNKMREFLQASDQKIVFSIPDYLQCKITFDIMEDPVVTDSGQTYERFAIEEHMEKNGRTDPFTRQPIKGPLYPSIAIKKAVQDFLDRNPWAYEYSEGEDYKGIEF